MPTTRRRRSRPAGLIPDHVIAFLRDEPPGSETTKEQAWELTWSRAMGLVRPSLVDAWRLVGDEILSGWKKQEPPSIVAFIESHADSRGRLRIADPDDWPDNWHAWAALIEGGSHAN